MLIARGSLDIAPVEWRWGLVFASRFWATLVEQDGVVLDTEFVPPASEPFRRGRCLYLVANGTFCTNSGLEVNAPSAIVMTEEHLEGASGRRPLTFVADGRPFSAIEMHVAEEDLRGPAASTDLPCTLSLREDTWTRARDAVATALRGDDAGTVETMSALLRALADEGVLAADVARAAHERVAFEILWRALRPMIERFALSSTVADLTHLAGLTARQLEKQIRAFVDRFGGLGLVGSGWRPATRHLRIKIAVMLLSAEGLSVSRVASAIGYGSTDAMARAFRDAGLAAPATVQAAMHARHASRRHSFIGS